MPEAGRAANFRSSIYQGSDGRWHGRVTMGVRDDGTPDRRHVASKDRAKVAARVRQLERQRDSGNIVKPGRPWTVEQWLTHWLENIARPSVRYKPYVGYRTAVYRHLIPGLGAHRIDRIEPEHFEKLYARMLAAGLKPGTAHQVHRTARAAFGEAFKRGNIVRNPVALARPPRVEDTEVDPFEADEVSRVLAAALTRRNGVRFVIALALGLRQGEALGLKWSRLHEPSKTLQIMQAVQRRAWQHGCADPHACGATTRPSRAPRTASGTSELARLPVPRTAIATPAGARSAATAAWSKSTSNHGQDGAVSPFPTSSTTSLPSTANFSKPNAGTRAPNGTKAVGCSRSRTASRSTLAAI